MVESCKWCHRDTDELAQLGRTLDADTGYCDNCGSIVRSMDLDAERVQEELNAPTDDH